MGGHADPGLVVTARVLPCAIMLFTRYSDKELARHRHTLDAAARGADIPVDEVGDSIIEGAQGLSGLAILSGLVCAASIWVSRRAAYVPFSVLGAVSVGVLGFACLLAAIYGARVMWRHPRLMPRHSDFWVAAGCGILIAFLVLNARLAG
jgi:hypothetical protein